jgi:hypothetical protein
MKAKTLIACAVTASALPLAAIAQNAQPSGPQGTQLYGNRQVLIMTFAQLDTNHDGVISREEYLIAEQRAPRVGPYQGFSADTNPPAPAP